LIAADIKQKAKKKHNKCQNRFYSGVFRIFATEHPENKNCLVIGVAHSKGFNAKTTWASA
jgi:hypothetical protein